MLEKMRSLCFFGAVFVVIMFGSRQVRAQTLEAEAFVHSVGGWYLVEVKDTTDVVMGFWGIPRVEVEVGNIRRLWFEVIPNDEWDVYAFEPVAIYEKLDDLKFNGASDSSIEFLIYQEFLAADTTINLDIDGGVEGLVLKGFIEGDPLTDAAGTLENPDPMIDLLADIGYPIAPGMTDLLVDGTAGASVGMNQATKQTLNCLRSLDASCGDCVCIKAEGPMTPTPWTVIETLMSDGRLRCEYTRTETHQYWQWGLYPDDCLDCTAGSADNPIIYDIVIEVTDFWFDMEQCPDEPLHY